MGGTVAPAAPLHLNPPMIVRAVKKLNGFYGLERWNKQV